MPQVESYAASSSSSSSPIRKPTMRVVKTHPQGGRRKADDIAEPSAQRKQTSFPKANLTVEVDEDYNSSSLHSAPAGVIRPLPSVPLLGVSLPQPPRSAPAVYTGTRFAHQPRIQVRPLPAPPPPPKGPLTFSPTSAPPIPYASKPVGNASRKRISKIRRHMGERVLMDYLHKHIDDSEALRKFNDMAEDGDDIPGTSHGHSSSEDGLSGVSTSKDSGDSSDDEEDEDQEDDAYIIDDDDHDDGVTWDWIIRDTTALDEHHTLIKRFSKRWMREQGGRRWVEQDYRSVLDALRKL